MSNNISEIRERLEEEVRKLGSPAAVANLMEIGKSTVYYWFKEGSITAEHLVRLGVLGADIGYVLTGKRTGQSHQDLVLVPRYSVRASAGPGNHVYDEEVMRTFAFQRDWLKRKGLKEEALSIISVQGDSMSGALEDGDLVLLDASDTEIKSGKAYVVRVEDELVVKYLQRLPGDKLQLSSHNQKYPPFTVDGAVNVDVVGRVVCSSHEW